MDQLTTEQYVMIATGVGSVIYLVICGAWGAVLSDEKHRSLSQGFWLGALFGPLGLIVVACMPTLAKPSTTEYHGALTRSRDEHDEEQLRRSRERQPLSEALMKLPAETKRYTDEEWQKRTPRQGAKPGPKNEVAMLVFEVSAEEAERLRAAGITTPVNVDGPAAAAVTEGLAALLGGVATVKSGQITAITLPASIADDLAKMLDELRAAQALPTAERSRLELWRDDEVFVGGTCCPLCLFKDTGIPEGQYEIRHFPERLPDAPRALWGRLDIFSDGIAVMRDTNGRIWRRDATD